MEPNMPLFLDRFPMPSLRVYATVSMAVLSSSIYYAAQIVKDPAWRSNNTIASDINDNLTENATVVDPRTIGVHMKELVMCMTQEPICVWVRIIAISINFVQVGFFLF